MCRFRNRRALTLIELMIATSIMAIMAGVLGGLALSVQMQSRHSQGHGEAVQHARVLLDRLERAMNESHCSSKFPGFFVVGDSYGAHYLPDTIVVWRPTGAAADPAGLPRWNEVIVYCPHPTTPNVLLEIRSPSDTSPVPSTSDLSTWKAELQSLKTSNAAEVIELTTLLRTANLASSGSHLQAALRFDTRLRPDDAQIAEFPDYRAWKDIDWVQGIYGAKTGLRQNWCRIEMQLQPGADADLDDSTGQSALTFFGSAAVYLKYQHE